MALVLSVMMVVTTIFSGVTVYADNAENGWTQQSEDQTATASDTVKVSKVTASDPEENNKNAIPSDMTEEELYQLSDEGKLTKAVLTRLGAIEPQETISVEDHIEFTCIVDDEDDQGHTDLKDYVRKDMDIKSLTPGSIENAAPKTIDYKGHNHMYRRAVVGNTPVYYAGILNVGGTEYVYYVTSQKNTERTVYSVLKDGEKINLLYVHKNAYTIDYELENDGNSDGPALQADDVFGADRTEVVEKNGSYTFKVQIPRGYKATVAVVDEDGSGKRELLTGSRTTLGEMIQYNNTPTKNEVTLKNGSPKTMLLNGTYEVNNVGCNQKILVKYKKVTTFKFSAEAWLKTQYANKNPREIRITNVTPTGTFNDDHSYTWKFTGSTAGGNTFEMNQLELNGEAIEVPMVTMKDTEAITSTTILSTGTVVTISVASNHGTNGKDAQRDYAVKIENCYEDITVSGGNMVGHRHKEIAVRRLIGVTAECYKLTNEKKMAWAKIESDSLIIRKNENSVNNTFRFKTDIGYGKPDIRILPKDALTILQENDKGRDNYIEYLYYSKEGADPESQHYASWLPSYDGNYYFRTTEKLKEYMEKSDAQGVVLLEIQGIPTKVGVNYVSGGDQRDSNGNMISPASSNIVNMPGFDNGGENGYNTINNQHVPISTLIPRDLSGKFEFDHWQVVTSLGAPKEGAVYATGQSAHLTTDTFNDLADCYHWDDARQRNVFTLQAVWKSDSVDTPINYAVHYYVDGQEIYTETHTANKGAKVVVDAWRSGTTGPSNAMLGVLRTNNAGKDYTDRGNVRYIIDKTISTTELQNLQQDNNALHVYFVTADTQWKVEKQWAFSTDQTTAPVEQITVQIQRKTEGGSEWEKVENSYGGVITLTSSNQWSDETGKLPLYEDDDVTKPYTYRVVEMGNDDKVVEEGKTITFNGSTNGTPKREFLVNYQKQGDTWTILNAETPTGALKVSNTVSGAQGDQTIAWEFTVEQNLDGAGNRLNGRFGGMEFQDGTAQFKLKHGESIIGVGFPAGTEFTVKETKANTDGYVSTCNTETLNGQGKNFKITSNTTATADFLNKKDLSKAYVFLKAIKYVNNATPSNAQKYTFYLKDDSGRQIQAVQNDQAAVNFRELEYSKAGTYTYYLMEADDGNADVQYSQLVYEADVKVEEVVETSGGYKLEATVTYKIPGGGIVNGTPEFKNQVNEAALTSVRVVKHWNDKESAKRPSSVKFQLYKKTARVWRPRENLWK